MNAGAFPTTKVDGRKVRSARTRAALLNACRTLMCRGDFRPSIASVAAQVGCSTRTGFEHFATYEALYVEALADPAVGRAILVRACDSDVSPLEWPAELQTAVVHAIVFGRPIRGKRLDVSEIVQRTIDSVPTDGSGGQKVAA